MPDLHTSTIDGAAAYARRYALSDTDPVVLRDVTEDDHDEHCICDTCTRYLSNETGLDFTFELNVGGVIEHRYRVNHIYDDSILVKGMHARYRIIFSGPGTATFIDKTNGRTTTITRIKMSDTIDK